MENYHAELDTTFRALADPTRRAVLRRLAAGAAPVKELAAPFPIGLPSFLKHLKILEEDGLIISEKVGRVRTCRIDIEKFTAAEQWFSEQRTLWQSRADRLADFVEQQGSRSSQDDD